MAPRRLRSLKLEFIIPGSPTEAFYSQIAFFALALRRLGAPYSNARIVFCRGNEDGVEPSPSWRAALGNVSVHQVAKEATSRDGVFAQIDGRFECVSPKADLTVFCDADTFVARRFDDLLLQLTGAPCLAGAIAHLPLPHRRVEHTAVVWNELFHKVLGKRCERWFRHTLIDAEVPFTDSICPFYVNYGFVAAAPSVWKSLQGEAVTLRGKLMPLLENPYFSAQAALTLAAHQLGAPMVPLPLRYNYPNDETADRLWPRERSNVAVYHYLRTGGFNRSKVFLNAKNFDRFLAAPLTGSDADIQRSVAEITNGSYPF